MSEPKPHWREEVVREELSRQGFVWSGPLPEVGWFGDSGDLASELGELVREGRKTATAGLLSAWEAEHGGPPLVGHREVVIDWARIPLAAIELTEVGAPRKRHTPIARCGRFVGRACQRRAEQDATSARRKKQSEPSELRPQPRLVAAPVESESAT